jgi:Pectate lyase superfamily protein
MMGAPMLLFADYDPVSVKDSRFGAVGDFATDDTAALQAAFDHCFGVADAPHGTANVRQKKALYIAPGHYKITAPLTVKYLHGGRIVGAGRFVTQIENVTSGSSVIVTNGCGYARFEGMRLTAAAGGKSFDLDWDGSAGGPALQSNTFCRHVLRRRRDRHRDRAFRLHGRGVIPACGDVDSSAPWSAPSAAPISHWTSVCFCNGCPGKNAGSMSQSLRVLV